MKVYRLLLFSVFLIKCTSIIEATPLSSESQKEIAISALKGGLTMASVYAAGYALYNNDLRFPCLLGNTKEYIIFAAIGALTMAGWRYNYVTESYYDYAHRELEKILHDKLIMIMLSVRGDQFIDQIKQIYVRETFPLVTAFKYMNSLYSRLESIDASIDNVLRSSRTDLHAACYEMQIIIQTIQSALENGLKNIKEEPQFITEYNAQTSLAMQQAQAVLAQAAHSQATAAWVYTLTD